MASYSVYTIETDKYLEQGISLPSVYVGMTSLSIEERLKERLTSRPLRQKYGKPLKLLSEFCVEKIPSEELANDIERLVWYKLKKSGKYTVLQKYAPSMMWGRKQYLDDYPNYEG